MTDLMEKALNALKVLKPEQQDAIAQTVLDMIRDELDELVDIPEEHMSAIDEGLAQIERGETVSYEEMKTVFAKYKA